MSHVESTTTIGIDHHLRVLARQWRIIVAVTLLGMVVAGGFLLVTTDRITAMTQVNLSVITTEPFSPQRAASGLLDDATEAAIASSYVVARRTASELDDGTTAGALHEAIDVTISEDGTIARVYATAATREDAIAHADAVTSTYLGYRSDEAELRRDAIVANLTERVDALNADLAEVNESLASAGSAHQEAQAASDREQILAELTQILSERTSLSSLVTTGGSVLTSAAQNPVTVAPSRKIAVATGIGGGLALGMLLAFVRDPRDRRLRTAAEIARATGTRVLARMQNPSARPPLSDADAENLAVIRERIIANLPATRRLLVIDDADVACGTAAELVATLAETGKRARLADPGMPDAAHLDGDGVVIVTPYATSDGQAELLAAVRQADAAILVAREGTTTSTTTRAVLDELHHAGVRFLGTVVYRRLRGARRLVTASTGRPVLRHLRPELRVLADAR
ncbi:hypothetical protein GCM10010915_28390 [Microbacterium faecale]|uniref:Polysaccharide chain length determinant N-terminal domain-containing protein n=1 Tax=Microbacterium faecale TaxID=1804630 RepID=A0A916YHV1_9MICO|nr:hypothetical protein [Microbacterium faecale]GGD45429.1 hypothetical protein GCM10010915_28390 [Microbacterium faecale]HJB63157.1 hypothetical protein [Candidatus Microbacterium pullistercoris]